jgi:hypothetical protein
MKKILLSLLFYSITTAVFGQTTRNIKEFGWIIEIPAGFDTVSKADWLKMQNRGEDAIEDVYGEMEMTKPRVVFVFNNSPTNYFEANYMKFDPAVDGDFNKSCIEVGNVLYETFKVQIPTAKLDTSYTKMKVDHLTFETFKLDINFAPDKVLHVYMFSRLFGKKMLTVNIMFLDAEAGDQMLKAFFKSKFH